MSLDGFLAGPDQSLDNPLGIGGQRLHKWMFPASGPGHEADVPAREDLAVDRGAYVMGRNMFGPDRGAPDLDWRGWWGEDPPFHVPVFVLTHHERPALEMEGGTTFHFVTGGIEAALEQARAAAGGDRVEIAGGASTVNQALAAGLIEELHLHTVPVLLGDGERLFAGAGDLALEPVEVTASPAATHVRYRITS